MDPNHQASLEFLEQYRPGGPWALTWVATEKNGIATVTFRPGDPILEWLADKNQTGNLYFHVNPTTHDITKKAAITDMAALDWLHVDIDPRPGEELEPEREWARGMLTDNLPEGVPPPTIIIDSGGGYQGFWKLRDPVPIDGDAEKGGEASRYNQQLEYIFSADRCHNVDRIMRLPGTINWPDERKRKKGRVPALASLVSFDEERIYDITQFGRAHRVQDVDDGPAAQKVVITGTASVDDLEELQQLNRRVKVVIQQGHDPNRPLAGEDQSRSAWLFYAVCKMEKAGLSDDVIYAIITDPKYLISESVRDKGGQMERYAIRQIQRAKEQGIDADLRELNDEYAVVKNKGGQCLIAQHLPDPLLNRRTLTYMSFEAFKKAYMNRKKEIELDDGKTMTKRLGDWWLEHGNRRTYEYETFAPLRNIPGAFNLWRGFAVDSIPGDKHEGFLRHVREVVCSGVPKIYDYLIGWMAMMVQYPARPGHVAVVLQGGRGIGKGFFINHFGYLWGQHYVHVYKPEHLTGKFNSHLQDCVLLFADEAFFAGDKRHESTLKGIITEDHLAIEAKGVDVTTSSNCVHVAMASNEKWVVPAGMDERRFLCLGVNETRKRDSTYFQAIENDLKNGGYENLLHFLETYDLTDFNVRDVPNTKELQSQKVRTMQAETEWWHAKLENGDIIDGKGWPKYVFSLELARDYAVYRQSWALGAHSNSTKLGQFLKSLGLVKKRLTGQHEVMQMNGKVAKMDRPWVYVLPSLKDSRKTWDGMGGPFEWPEEDTISDITQEEPF